MDPYRDLGFVGFIQSGDEIVGDCVFCDAENKLYINSKTGLFSCKKCGREGNQVQFFTMYCAIEKHITNKFQRLSENRRLPAWVFKEAGICKNSSHWLLPLRSSNGNVVGIKKFKLTEKIRLINLSGLETFLFGLETVNNNTETVVICEGEWDAMTARVMLKDQGIANVAAISLPGAKSWKTQWNAFVEGRDVILIFDKDDPGRAGLKRTWKILNESTTRPRSLSYILWHDDIPEGKDLRDFYIAGGTWDMLLEMLSTEPNWATNELVAKTNYDDRLRYTGKRISFNEVLETFNKWMTMTEEHVNILRIMFATIITVKISGDPLWIYLVGPPGAGKTEILMSASECVDVKFVSTVTPHSLVSGWNSRHDPSLIPQIIGKTLILKDFTEIIEMNKTQRDDVYSILRGAFDGEVIKQYGNGVSRKYNGYFNMIAGVTYAIDREIDSSLGERFLKYRMTQQNEDTRREILFGTLQNTGMEPKMKSELQDVCKRFLDPPFEDLEEVAISAKYLDRLINLAEMVGLFRTFVDRDFVQRDRIRYRPISELGTRVAKQLKKLLIGLAVLNTDNEPTDLDMEIVSRCAVHTCIPFYIDIIRSLYTNPDANIQDIAQDINLPITTVREVLDSMLLLGIIGKKIDENVSGHRRPYLWYLQPHIIDMWKGIN